jgi:hypothetical protein
MDDSTTTLTGLGRVMVEYATTTERLMQAVTQAQARIVQLEAEVARLSNGEGTVGDEAAPAPVPMRGKRVAPVA